VTLAASRRPGRSRFFATIFPRHRASFRRWLTCRRSQVMRRLYPTGGMLRSEDKEYRQRHHRPSYQHDNAVEEHSAIMTQNCCFEYEVP
jgi:hypothetical protein